MSGRDPRYRPYRAVLWALYFASVLLGVGLIVFSVARSLHSDTARSSGAPATLASLRVCETELETLFREHNQRALALGAELERPAPFETWNRWARAWEQRIDDLAHRCGLDGNRDGQAGSAARADLAVARDAIVALHRAYALHLNRFAAEEGELVRFAVEALARARAAVSQGR